MSLTANQTTSKKTKEAAQGGTPPGVRYRGGFQSRRPSERCGRPGPSGGASRIRGYADVRSGRSHAVAMTTLKLQKTNTRARSKQRCYLLPLQWSLYYIMTSREWDSFKERVKKSTVNWNKCSCPKRCNANHCDEQWNYDTNRHLKRFIKAQYICSGCHWLKSPGARVITWQDQEAGLLPSMTKPPHLIRCLGWTRAQISELRKRDLEESEGRKKELSKIQREVERGEMETLCWEIDLSAMKRYDYSKQEIAVFEGRMRSRGVGKSGPAQIVPPTGLGWHI